MGFGVQGSGVGVSGLGLGVWGSVLGMKGSDFRFLVSLPAQLAIQGLGVQGLGVAHPCSETFRRWPLDVASHYTTKRERERERDRDGGRDGGRDGKRGKDGGSKRGIEREGGRKRATYFRKSFSAVEPPKMIYP